MKPYIITHMMMSVDGQIDCPMVGQLGTDEYYIALERLGKCSKLSGRVTAALECTAVKEETASGAEGTPVGHEAFNVGAKADEYTIVVDTRGRLLWQSAEADGLPILTIVTEDVSEEYLDSLTAQGISWIASGIGRIDLRRAMDILRTEFGVERLAIVGGGHICGGFVEAGLVDEVSVMVAPGIDGREGQTAMIDGIRKTDDTSYKLKLESVEKWNTDIVWLRYTVKYTENYRSGR